MTFETETECVPITGSRALLARWMAKIGAALVSVATSPLTTKGDIWGYDTGNNRIPVGANTQVLTADSSQTLGVKWAPASGGATSPLTTKGDVWGYTTVDARVPVGANNTVLTADSTQTLGLKWATPAASTFTRATVTKTTASLANNARESGTVTMAKTWMIAKVVADRACRIRLYDTTALRDADATRGAFVKPSGNAGCVFDLVLSAAVLTWYPVPNVSGSDDDAGPVANVPVTIDNLSGSTSTVAVTFTYFALET